MSEIKHSKIEEIPASHRCEHEGYEYFRRKFIPFGGAKNALVSVYEIPPEKLPILIITTIKTRKPSISSAARVF